MAVFVALLRGINVGGNNIIPMAELKVLFGDLGMKNTRTLLQSGNVVFETKAVPAATLAKKIADAIRKRFKVDIEIVVRTAKDLRHAVAKNPFADAARDDPSHLLIAFIAGTPSPTAAKAFATAKFAPERFHLGDELYAHYGAGIGKSKVPSTFVEKTLGTRATARNWNTVTKLIAIADELESA